MILFFNSMTTRRKFKHGAYKKMESRQGSCVPAAYEDVMHGIFQKDFKDGRAEVVHGWVLSFKLNATIKHAWIEFRDKDELYEPVTEQFLNKEMAYAIWKMKPMKRYDYMQLMKRSVITGSAGGQFEF
jgi:hypothetical protein